MCVCLCVYGVGLSVGVCVYVGSKDDGCYCQQVISSCQQHFIKLSTNMSTSSLADMSTSSLADMSTSSPWCGHVNKLSEIQ